MINKELVVTGNIYKFNFVLFKYGYLGNRLYNIAVHNFCTKAQVTAYMD